MLIQGLGNYSLRFRYGLYPFFLMPDAIEHAPHEIFLSSVLKSYMGGMEKLTPVTGIKGQKAAV